jgi:hypothetical protein
MNIKFNALSKIMKTAFRKYVWAVLLHCSIVVMLISKEILGYTWILIRQVEGHSARICVSEVNGFMWQRTGTVKTEQVTFSVNRPLE